VRSVTALGDVTLTTPQREKVLRKGPQPGVPGGWLDEVIDDRYELRGTRSERLEEGTETQLSEAARGGAPAANIRPEFGENGRDRVSTVIPESLSATVNVGMGDTLNNGLDTGLCNVAQKCGVSDRILIT